jgi:hypothetical protein
VGGGQLVAIWFPAGLFEKLAYLENCSMKISFGFLLLTTKSRL